MAWGALASLALLDFFLVLAAFDASVLHLESRWLVAAGVPLLVALIAGGYIRKFKGFGVEVEARVTAPTSAVALEVLEAISLTPRQLKESVGTLRAMPQDALRKMRILVLDADRPGEYDAWAIDEYLRSMPHLRFVEFRRAGRFLCL